MRKIDTPPLGLPGKRVSQIAYALAANDPRLKKFFERDRMLQRRRAEIEKEIQKLGEGDRKELEKLIKESIQLDNRWSKMHGGIYIKRRGDIRWYLARRIQKRYRQRAETLINQAIAGGHPDVLDMHIVGFESGTTRAKIIYSAHFPCEGGYPLPGITYSHVCGRRLWFSTSSNIDHPSAHQPESRGTVTLSPTMPTLPAYEGGLFLENTQTGEIKTIYGGVEKFGEFSKAVQEFTGVDQEECEKQYQRAQEEALSRQLFPSPHDPFLIKTAKGVLRKYFEIKGDLPRSSKEITR